MNLSPNSTPNFYNYQQPKNDSKYVLKCIFGVVLLVIGFFSIVIFHSVLGGLLRTIAGLLLFPPSLAKIESALKIKINRVVRYVSIVALVQISFILSISNWISKNKHSETQEDSITELNNSNSIVDTVETVVESDQERIQRQNEAFKKHLSGWDGSFLPLKLYVRRNMNDPDSFEHIETVFFNAKNYAVVIMKFRGKNAFGGKVINIVKAKVSWEGELIEIVNNSE